MSCDGASLGKTLSKGVSYLYLMQVVLTLMGIATNLTAGKLLNPSDYGSFATSVFVVSLVSLISDASLAQVLIRQSDEVHEKDFAAVFTFQAAVGLVLGLALYLGAFFAGSAFGENRETAQMIRWLAPLPFLSSFLTVPLVKIERALHYGKFSALSVIWSVTERLVLILFMILGMRGFSYVYSRFIGVLLQIVLLSFASPWNPLALVREVLLRGWHGVKYLRFGFALIVRNASTSVALGVIPGLGGRLFSPEQVGRVAWAHNMATTVGTQLPQMIGKALVGASSRLGSDAAKITETIENSVFACTVLMGTGLAVLTATFEELLTLLFRSSWTAAAPYFALSCVVMVLSILSIIFDSLLIVLGRAKSTAAINWVWALTILISGYGFSLWIGPAGLILGHLMGAVVMSGIFYFITRKSHPVRLIRNFVIPVVVSFGIWGATGKLKAWVPLNFWMVIAFDFLVFASGLLLQGFFQPRFFRLSREFLGAWKR